MFDWEAMSYDTLDKDTSPQFSMFTYEWIMGEIEWAHIDKKLC